MSRHALHVFLGLGLAAAAAGCRPSGPDPKDPMSVAKAYHADLRDARVDQARGLATFEDENARKEWDRQVQDYVQRRKAGGRKWWGEVFKVTPARGAGPGEWAFAEVQWHYHTKPGWRMGPKYTYPMRTVDGRWKMVIDNERIEKGIPFFPADNP